MEEPLEAICPQSPKLPELSEEPGTLCFAPPLRHTLDRLYGALSEAGWDVSVYGQEVIGVEVRAGGLPELLAELRQRMSHPEMEDSPAVFLERGESFDIASLSRARPLSRLAARAENRWLTELIREERIRILYQPIVWAEEASRVFAYECLLRGLSPQGTPVSPASLYKAAELSGLQFYLDRMARERTIRESHRLAIDEHLFINFRPAAIYHPASSLSETAATVRELDLDPRGIVFEVTESEAGSDPGHMQRIAQEYRQGGFRIALDNLGAGYGSLNLLKDLEPDFVKIDRELVQNVYSDHSKASLVEAVVRMARQLQTTVVAEGVEVRREFDWLREAGVDLMQGFFIARPNHPPPTPG